MNLNKLTEIDSLIGKKIYELRTIKSISKTDMSRVLGISVQQLTKYENAVNRISASKLFLISQTFGIKMSFFYSEIDSNIKLDENFPKNYFDLAVKFYKLREDQYKSISDIVDIFIDSNNKS